MNKEFKKFSLKCYHDLVMCHGGDCQSINWVSVAQWFDHWHGIPEALGLSPC